MAMLALGTATVQAQPAEPATAWQVEKCRIYAENWNKALDSFGTDNLNYNFIAQNENFIAGGCTEPAEICPQSSQELEITDLLTMVMMNAGAASTFVPFRCPSTSSNGPAEPTSAAASEAMLCRAQLDLLMRGEKLTEAEAEVYEAQCACLEQNQGQATQSACAQ